MRQLVVAAFFAEGSEAPNELASEVREALLPFKASGTAGSVVTYQAAHKQTAALLEALADLNIDASQEAE